MNIKILINVSNPLFSIRLFFKKIFQKKFVLPIARTNKSLINIENNQTKGWLNRYFLKIKFPLLYTQEQK
ncbi:MAG: hypothetical protein ACJA1N_000065 [Saprospiraceae bacterium]|jgi:hypothetical protein